MSRRDYTPDDPGPMRGIVAALGPALAAWTLVGLIVLAAVTIVKAVVA